MTAPIFFNEALARHQLLSHGTVYTLRRERAVGLTRARWGSYHKFRDLGLVEVKHVVRRPADRDLGAFLHLSGFADVEAWTKAAAPGSDHVYVVELVTRYED